MNAPDFPRSFWFQGCPNEVKIQQVVHTVFLRMSQRDPPASVLLQPTRPRFFRPLPSSPAALRPCRTPRDASPAPWATRSGRRIRLQTRGPLPLASAAAFPWPCWFLIPLEPYPGRFSGKSVQFRRAKPSSRFHYGCLFVTQQVSPRRLQSPPGKLIPSSQRDSISRFFPWAVCVVGIQKIM
jgi:hypothetical protein